MVIKKITKLLGVIVALCIVGLMSGCASSGVKPTDSLSKAQAAIESAKRAEASSYAPLDLRIAEDKLVKARNAVDGDEYEKGARLADEALVDARLAEKKAELEKAKQATEEMRDTIEALRRATGAPQR